MSRTIAREDRGAPASGASALPPILLERVSKSYRGARGISEVDLEVRAGEVFAFLGPNGAGKTTTIRLLLDLIRPDAGRVRLFGCDPRRQGPALRRRIGYLPGELGLYEHLSGFEMLTHFAHLRGGPPPAQIIALAERFDLDLARPVKALSKGNRQKVGLIQALMGEPELLILDEPTSGLDPVVQNQVLGVIRAAAGEGRTVFLSSHVLAEVAAVAHRVGIINEGRIVTEARVDDLRAAAVHYVDVRFASGDGAGELAALPGVRQLDGSTDAGPARFAVTGALDPVVRVLARHQLADLSIHEPDLEELFLGALGVGTGGGGQGDARD